MLRNSSFWWLSVDYDPVLGRGRVRRSSERISGFAFWKRLRWHALWNNGGRLCFQVGRRRWYPDDGWSAQIEDHGLIREFRLVRGTERAFRVRYSRLLVEIKAMLDDDDGELGDFFLWVSRTWSSKKRQEDLLNGLWIPGAVQPAVAADEASPRR